jgi:hypothetical protein
MVGRARWKVGAGGSSARNIVAGGKPVRAPEWTACRAQELAHGFQPGPVEKKGEGEKGPAAKKRVMVEGESVMERGSGQVRHCPANDHVRRGTDLLGFTV